MEPLSKIKGLRFVERYVPAPHIGKDMSMGVQILQFFDGTEWVDVPLVNEQAK